MRPGIALFILALAWSLKAAPAIVHWSFAPISDPELPHVKDITWPTRSVDRFILARLESAQLKPVRAASPREWLRRASFDLTGLPPTPEQIARLQPDETGLVPESRYTEQVDEWLSSSTFGQRWARHWLDVARFGESAGKERNHLFPEAWRYRDWVVDAFNHDKPYRDFIREQIAGDLLAQKAPPSDRDALIVATGFLAIGTKGLNEGRREQFLADLVDEQIDTTTRAILGLTVACARCHDHKYDPISQKEFYQLFAFFQNIDESGQSVYFGDIMPVPTLLLSTPEQDAKLKDLNSRIRAGETRLGQVAGDARAAFEEWRSKASSPVPEVSGAVARFSFDAMVSNAFPSTVGTHRAQPFEAPGSVEGRWGKALLLSGENGVSMPGIGHFSRADPFSISLWIQPAMHVPRQTVIHHSSAWMDAGSRGYEILLEDGKVAVGLHHMWPGNALKVRTRKPAPVGSWTHVAFAYDGSSRAAGLKVYLDGNVAEVEIVRDNLWKDITYGQPNLTIGQRMRDFGFKQGRVDELQVFDRTLSPVEVAVLAGRESAPDEAALFQHFLLTRHAPHREAAEALVKLRREQNALVTSIADIMVMEEMAQPKPAHVLRRGMYDQPGDAVTMDTPAVMGRLPAGAPRNRLGLSQWLLDPSHPLMGRVTVNRVWQHQFGVGLVDTPNDFGRNGSNPTHPELLDWLAGELIRGGWRLKPMHRLMMTSHAYRQSSAVSEAKAQRDPNNSLVSRRVSSRLEAEAIRDSLLWITGALDATPFGPGTLDESSRRRSIYFTVKRSQLIPSMQAFDAPEPLVSQGTRPATTVAPQALWLMNNPQIRQWADHWAKEYAGPSADAARWLPMAYQQALQRPPNPTESKASLDFLARQADRYRKAGTGHPEQRAATDLLHALLSLNEVIYVD